MRDKPFYVCIVYTVSRHETERGAVQALRRLQGSGEDVAMVVRMPRGTDGPPSYKDGE